MIMGWSRHVKDGHKRLRGKGRFVEKDQYVAVVFLLLLTFSALMQRAVIAVVTLVTAVVTTASMLNWGSETTLLSLSLKLLICATDVSNLTSTLEGSETC